MFKVLFIYYIAHFLGVCEIILNENADSRRVVVFVTALELGFTYILIVFVFPVSRIPLNQVHSVFNFLFFSKNFKQEQKLDLGEVVR